MSSRPRKSSAHVTLVLIGAAAAVGCSPSTDKHYATKEACIADWGNPDDCEQQFAQQGDGTRRSYYSYAGGHSGGTRGSSTHGSGSAGRSVARGGFGSSAHAHSSGS